MNRTIAVQLTGFLISFSAMAQENVNRICPDNLVGKIHLTRQAVYQPRPAANAGTPISGELELWVTQAGLQTTIERSKGEVRYQFWDGTRRSEVRLKIPGGIDNSLFPKHQEILTPDSLPKPLIRERTREKADQMRDWQLQKQIHNQLTKIYRYASMAPGNESRIDISEAHERFEAALYLQMLGKGQTDQLDGRLLIPSNKDVNWPFIIDRPAFRVAGLADGLSSIHRFYFREIQPIKGFDPVRFLVGAVKDYGILNKLGRGKVGIGFHVDRADGTSIEIEVLAGEGLATGGLFNDPFYRQLPAEVWDQVFAIYRQRMKDIPEELFQRARSISQQVVRRSIVIAVFEGKDSFTVPFFEPGSYPTFVPETSRDSHQMRIKGAITAVLSSSPNEPLPLELLSNFRIPRNGKKILEVGRFGVPKGESPETSAAIVALTAALGAGTNDIDQLVLVAEDEVHARRWERNGFQRASITEAAAQGVTVMTTKPADLLRKQGLD